MLAQRGKRANSAIASDTRAWGRVRPNPAALRSSAAQRRGASALTMALPDAWSQLNAFSCHLGQRHKNFDRIVGYEDGVFFGALNQAQYFESAHVGVDIRVIAPRSLG